MSAPAELTNEADDEGMRRQSARNSIDMSYEFNAPQYVNLESDATDDDPIQAEAFFDKKTSKESVPSSDANNVKQAVNTVDEKLASTNSAVKTPFERKDVPGAPCVETTLVKEKLTTSKVSLLAPESIAAMMTKTPTAKTRTKSMTVRQTVNNTSSNLMRPTKASDKRALHYTSTVSSGVKKELKTTQRTIPKTPNFSVIRSHKSQSSEELELQRLQQEMRDASERRARNQQQLRRVNLSGSVNTNTHSTKALTIPQPFNFASTKVKRVTALVDETHSKQKQSKRANSLRSLFASEDNSFMLPTTRSRSRSHTRSLNGSVDIDCAASDPGAPEFESFKSLANRTNGFFSERSTDLEGEKSSRSSISNTRTLPNEFHLSESKRKNSYAGHEALELEKIASHPSFKAKPVHRKVMQSVGDLGVPRVRKKELTVTHSFHLSEPRKLARRQSVSEDSFTQFRARPIPSSIRRSSCRMNAQQPVLTVPQSPHLSKPRTRIIPSSSSSPPSPNPPTFHARPMPDFGRLSPKPQMSARAATVPVPFPLATEERGAKKQQELRQKIRRERAEEKAKALYHARPLVLSEPMTVHQSTQPLTEPKPFQLQSVERSERHRLELERKVNGNLEKENAAFSSFRAKEPVVLSKEPFTTRLGLHEPVVPDNFVLSTEQRSEQRREFKKSLDEQRLQAAEVDARRRKQRELQEKIALDEAFQEQAFHARPCPSAPLTRASVKSKQLLTVPHSPAFATNFRRRVARV